MLSVNDFFSGCGGLSQGFKEAGFKIQVAVDKEEAFLKTFSHNFKDSQTKNLDLGDSNTLKDIPKSDIIIAGPPCQGFSITGPRNIDDPRNKLYLSVFETLKLTNPKAFVVENVRGLKTMWGGNVFKEIIKKFESAGYIVTESLLNSADYGVPQIRHRVFIVGIKKELNKKFEFPKPEFDKDAYITCGEAIGNLPSLENGELRSNDYNEKPTTNYERYVMVCNKLYNHEVTLHKQFVKYTIALVPEGGNYKDLPKGVGDSRKFNEAWTRYHSRKPSKTIDTGHRNHFHYLYNRVPSVRENCRFQSFPDSFTVHGSKTSQNKQIGNAVPVLLAKVLAEKIYEQIECN